MKYYLLELFCFGWHVANQRQSAALRFCGCSKIINLLLIIQSNKLLRSMLTENL